MYSLKGYRPVIAIFTVLYFSDSAERKFLGNSNGNP